MVDEKDDSKEQEEGAPASDKDPSLRSSDAQAQQQQQPSMTVALFVCWIIPVFLIAVFGRNLADTEIPTIPVEQQRQPRSVPMHQQTNEAARRREMKQQQPSPQPKGDTLSVPSAWPTEYSDLVQSIHRRRRHIEGFEGGISNEYKVQANGDTTNRGGATSPTTATTTKRTSSGRANDPMRSKFHQKISALRDDYQQHPNDVYRAIGVADAMRFYDMQFHEGGTYELEALELYDKIIKMVLAKRQAAIAAGEPTNQSLSSSSDDEIKTVNDEVILDYPLKSIDGLLCAIYTAQGKLYFMANMFERAVESYDQCLQDDIEPYYLDALNARASALIVLGKYDEAGRDFLQVINRNNHHHRSMFIDCFTGIARILEAKEDAVPGGWNSVIGIIQDDLIPTFETEIKVQTQAKNILADSLNRLHHVLFTYHDVKTKDYAEAFRHLTEGYKYKMSVLPPWTAGSEQAKIFQTKNIFKSGFWSPGLGSRTRTPIFIIGFVRSGSTLLERILDAHPLIAGTGENSVFNGRLDDIRNQIVQASVSGQSNALGDLIQKLADDVVDEMRRRWEIVDANTEKPASESSLEAEKPQRFVDKMLTNYYNVGFIQMLYPNALILHVAREPMDTIFSAYKHEFPSGTLDYTSDYTGLSELYHAYRDIMQHWDQVLPGRITHIRYEDMVKDFEGVARAIIKATGLPWDDSVLEFHKKKHAVNTLSSTQVRKGVYKDSLKSWMRYEKELQPLIDRIGERVKYDFKTSLPGYQPKDAAE